MGSDGVRSSVQMRILAGQARPPVLFALLPPTGAGMAAGEIGGSGRRVEEAWRGQVFGGAGLGRR